MWWRGREKSRWCKHQPSQRWCCCCCWTMRRRSSRKRNDKVGSVCTGEEAGLWRGSTLSLTFNREEEEPVPGVWQLLIMYQGVSATHAAHLETQTTPHQPKLQGGCRSVSSCSTAARVSEVYHPSVPVWPHTATTHHCTNSACHWHHY